jgi:hypothetical protein
MFICPKLTYRFMQFHEIPAEFFIFKTNKMILKLYVKFKRSRISKINFLYQEQTNKNYYIPATVKHTYI